MLDTTYLIELTTRLLGAISLIELISRLLDTTYLIELTTRLLGVVSLIGHFNTFTLLNIFDEVSQYVCLVIIFDRAIQHLCLKKIPLIEINNLQSNFNGSKTFGTMKICSRKGEFERLRVYYRARSGGIKRDIFSIFFKMKVYCVYSLELPQRGDSNKYIQYTISQYKKEINSKLSQICNYRLVPRDPRTNSNQPW